MTAAAKQHSETKARTARASISFPADLYSELERIAEQKKVSVAWVVRDAVDKYIAAQYPLFSQQ